jgi:hypothetical protein
MQSWESFIRQLERDRVSLKVDGQRVI